MLSFRRDSVPFVLVLAAGFTFLAVMYARVHHSFAISPMPLKAALVISFALYLVLAVFLHWIASEGIEDWWLNLTDYYSKKVQITCLSIGTGLYLLTSLGLSGTMPEVSGAMAIPPLLVYAFIQALFFVALTSIWPYRHGLRSDPD